jgi:ferrous iron transport protein A
MTADTIQIDKHYKIHSLNDNEFTHRLVEMGCIKGTNITKVFQAPLGDPMAYQVDNFVLSLRIEEAKTIIVE